MVSARNKHHFVFRFNVKLSLFMLFCSYTIARQMLSILLWFQSQNRHPIQWTLIDNWIIINTCLYMYKYTLHNFTYRLMKLALFHHIFCRWNVNLIQTSCQLSLKIMLIMRDTYSFMLIIVLFYLSVKQRSLWYQDPPKIHV